jgi:hypothetical protein
MEFRLLDAGEDADRWRGCFLRMAPESRDIYFSPEWALLHAFSGRCAAKAATFEREGQLWLYPFVLREIDPIGADRVGAGGYDLETPYGYGGPISTSEDPGFLARAGRAFEEWCRAQGVVAEFVRFHPLLGNSRLAPAGADPEVERETVSMDLRRLSGESFAFGGSAGNMIRRALSLGCRAEILRGADGFDGFRTLYLETMARKGAGGFYEFDDHYFRELERVIGESGCVVAVFVGTEMVGAGVFIWGDRWMHYHLSGSKRREGLVGINNLMLRSAAEFGASRGLSRLHLGGGMTSDPGDPLLKFKRSMGTDRHTFHIARRVHRRDAYERLVSAWEAEYPKLKAKFGDRVLCYRER